MRSKLVGLFTLPLLLLDTARPQREKARWTLWLEREEVSSQFNAPISSATAIAAIIPSPGPRSLFVRTSTIGAEQDRLTLKYYLHYHVVRCNSKTLTSAAQDMRPLRPPAA